MRPRRKRLPHVALTPALLQFLHGGSFVEWRSSFESYLTTEAAIVRLWNVYRDEVLKQWIREKPGTRPDIWWHFEAPREFTACPECPEALYAMRRQVFGPCLNFDAIKPQTICGLPGHLYFGRWDGLVPLAENERGSEIMFESEAAFLRRHNLLTADELSRVTKADFAPVEWPAESSRCAT